MFGEWDLEKFENSITKVQLEKWQVYLLHKVETEAMISSLIQGDGIGKDKSRKITNMEEKADFLRSLAL